MLKIEMLPARYGDCLWIECGSPSDPTRILIDGGVASCWTALEQHIEKRFEGLPKSKRHIDLLVISHIDADHIEGAVMLLRHGSIAWAMSGSTTGNSSGAWDRWTRRSRRS